MLSPLSNLFLQNKRETDTSKCTRSQRQTTHNHCAGMTGRSKLPPSILMQATFYIVDVRIRRERDMVEGACSLRCFDSIYFALEWIIVSHGTLNMGGKVLFNALIPPQGDPARELILAI